MSIASVILRGFGNGTVTGSTSGVILRGYTIAESVGPTLSDTSLGVSGGIALQVGASGVIRTTVGITGGID